MGDCQHTCSKTHIYNDGYGYTVGMGTGMTVNTYGFTCAIPYLGEWPRCVKRYDNLEAWACQQLSELLEILHAQHHHGSIAPSFSLS